jgi:hypothetical protein
VLFAGTFVAMGLLLAAVASGRTWRLHFQPQAQRVLLGVAAAVLAVSWSLKLFWLGN